MSHPYGWFCLAPPVVAVVLAILTRRILFSLLVGLFAGAMLTTSGDLLAALIALGETHLWPTFIDPSKLRLFTFTMAMGATVGLLHRAGGMQGFVQLMTPLANTRRSGQLTGWAMGLAVFFDDYANTLLLGGALRPVFDRLRISREKLAYLVDSTAAPVAGLALISTWVAVEIAYVQEGLDNLAPTTLGADAVAGASAFSLFVACLPYRFYVIQALLFVPIVALLGRDFGPMLAAERQAKKTRGISGGRDSVPIPFSPEDEGSVAAAAANRSPTPSHWSNAVVPLAAMLAAVIALLWTTGMANLAQALPADASLSDTLRKVFGAANSGLALQYGAFTGLLVALVMTRLRALLSTQEIRNALIRGVLTVLPAVAILWLAASMSRMTGNKSAEGAPSAVAFEYTDYRLYTGEFLSGKLLGSEGEEPSDLFKAILPTAIFLLSAIVAFCTGTSFGTMGLVVPMVVPLAISAASGEPDPLGSPLLLASLGGVLAGAIFGDHCSPISDTTILSSQASGCNHMAHVRTQLPYALLIATVCVFLGTLPLGMGINVWLLLPLQTMALVGLLFLLGKKP